MLVISRRRGESFTIAGGITVHVLQVSARETRIGIDAPKQTKILRSELRLKETVDEVDGTSESRQADSIGCE